MDKSITKLKGTKRLFLKKGTCSHTFFHILNRELGHLDETGERASDPFCGGLMQKGEQCGMLWGSTLAVGAKAARRHDDHGRAIAAAITATQFLMDSFEKRTNTVLCRDVTRCDFSTKWGMIKCFLSPAFFRCIRLAGKWAPEAIEAATEGLDREQSDLKHQPVSCATEVAQKMGASDEEMLTVAGFAGGMGLSGNACGALSAAIWINVLKWCRENPGKSSYPNPVATKTLDAFLDATGSEILCHKIAGKRFKSIDDHTEFMKDGGCDKIIRALAAE